MIEGEPYRQREPTRPWSVKLRQEVATRYEAHRRPILAGLTLAGLVAAISVAKAFDVPMPSDLVRKEVYAADQLEVDARLDALEAAPAAASTVPAAVAADAAFARQALEVLLKANGLKLPPPAKGKAKR